MITKTIRLTLENIQSLQLINNDINLAVTELLQKCNNPVTTVTNPLQSVTNCNTTVTDINKFVTKEQLDNELNTFKSKLILLTDNKYSDRIDAIESILLRNRLK